VHGWLTFHRYGCQYGSSEFAARPAPEQDLIEDELITLKAFLFCDTIYLAANR
jgi:hypothetical protein